MRSRSFASAGKLQANDMNLVPSTLGIEIELAVSAVDQHGDTIPSDELFAKLMRFAVHYWPVLLTTNGLSIVFTNGGMLGPDCGKLELRTPACCDAIELERYRKAMLQHAFNLLKSYANSDPEVASISLSRASVDYLTGAFWGGRHTQVTHTCAPEALRAPLTPALVALAPLTGEGGFDPSCPGLSMVRSPRLVCFTVHVGSTSQNERAILHTKQPGHCKDVFVFHSLLGGNNFSELSSVFFSAVLHRAIQAIDAGKFPRLRLLDDPVDVLHLFNHDLHAKARTSKGSLTAWQMLEEWQPFLFDVMPMESDNFESIWERISVAYANNQELPNALDCDIKKFHYEAFLEHRGLPYKQVEAINKSLESHMGAFQQLRISTNDVLRRLLESRSEDLRAVREHILKELDDSCGLASLERLAELRPELLALDTRWSIMGVDGSESIFSQLESQGVLDHRVDGVTEITRAMEEPSSVPRDAMRGEWVKANARQRGCHADWDGLYDAKRGVFLEMRNPFAPAIEWKPIAHLPRTYRENNAIQRRLPVLSQLLNTANQNVSSGDSVPSVRQLARERIYA